MLSPACLAQGIAVVNLLFNLPCRVAGCVRDPDEEEECVGEVRRLTGGCDGGRRLDGELRLRKLARSWSETF